MNSFFLLFIGLPVLEVWLMIKVGGKIGALNTVILILLTAIIGVYFAKMQGVKTIRTGVVNLYQNKNLANDIISGASIAIAALLLITPGFLTDSLGFLLLIPFSRKIMINLLVPKKQKQTNQEDKEILDGEIIEDKKDEL
jgi:UPF0716 protein FxsA